jgi:hypothetical protein
MQAYKGEPLVGGQQLGGDGGDEEALLQAPVAVILMVAFPLTPELGGTREVGIARGEVYHAQLPDDAFAIGNALSLLDQAPLRRRS